MNFDSQTVTRVHIYSIASSYSFMSNAYSMGQMARQYFIYENKTYTNEKVDLT